MLRECESRTKKRTFGKISTGQRRKKNVPVSSKKTNSMAEGRIWIILTKYQITKFWNNFILGKHPAQTSDPCFTNLLTGFFVSLLVLSVQCLRRKIYYEIDSASNHRHCFRQTGRKPVHTHREFSFNYVLDSKSLPISRCLNSA